MEQILTSLNILYVIAGLLVAAFIIETTAYLINRNRIKNWKPDITKMHYFIRTATETCVPRFSRDDANDIYMVEFKEILSERMLIKKVITPEQFIAMSKLTSIDIEASTLRIYVVTPNEHVLYRDYVRTNQEDNYKPYTKSDISFNLLRIAAEYFKRNCPLKKNTSKKKSAEISYVEGLPSVVGYKKRPRA